jgi:hypothetical protein
VEAVANAFAPLTDDDRERVRQLHTAGACRNDIAREIGRSPSTVSKLAKQLGLSFDRSKVKAATAAKAADAKAKRAVLMNNLLDDAERLRQQLWHQAHVYSFGGKDNTFAEAYVEQPSFRDQRDIVQAVNTALGASLRLDQHDGDGSIEQVGSLLGSLFDTITGRHAEDQAPADDDGG